MASKCPKCHRILEEDAICCAGVRYTWKCRSCAKLTQGFVVPYGKCFLCGGDIEVVSDRDIAASEDIEVVRSAVQMEVDMYHFYKMAVARAADGPARDVLEDLYEREQEHIEELATKYHLDLDNAVFEPPPAVADILEKELFSGVSIDESDSMKKIYEKALELERRSHSFFAERAAALPEGREKEICRELAAEEEEHVALLETELQHF